MFEVKDCFLPINTHITFCMFFDMKAILQTKKYIPEI